MKIKAVSKTEHGEFVMITLVGEKKALTLSDKAYRMLGEPCVGCELSDEEYSEALLADERYRALKKALNILSFGDNSQRKLYEKLRRSGFSAETSRSTVEDMCELGYLNEQKQIERIVSTLANNSLYGPKRITAKLIGCGYSSSDVRRAISELSHLGEIDFDSSLERLVDKHLGDSYDGEALIKLKYKYGYK